MNAALQRRAVRIRVNRTWLLVAAVTLASMAMSRSGLAGPAVNGAVLTLATIKARALVWNFLNIRSASSGWRAVFVAWLLVIAIAAWATAAASLFVPAQ